MIQDVVHLGFQTTDSDVGSFSRGRTGDPNLRRRRRAEEIRLVAQRNRDVAGSIRSRPRIRRFRLLFLNAIPDGMRIHEIWAIAADGPAVRIQTGRSEDRFDSKKIQERRPRRDSDSTGSEGTIGRLEIKDSTESDPTLEDCEILDVEECR